jgi:hypothetical protein
MKHKAFLIIICMACAVFLLIGFYPHKIQNPDPTQILTLKLAKARNVEIENLRKILSDFGMRKPALEKAPAG